jgi:hypothetical protein
MKCGKFAYNHVILEFSSYTILVIIVGALSAINSVELFILSLLLYGNNLNSFRNHIAVNQKKLITPCVAHAFKYLHTCIQVYHIIIIRIMCVTYSPIIFNTSKKLQ